MLANARAIKPKGPLLIKQEGIISTKQGACALSLFLTRMFCLLWHTRSQEQIQILGIFGRAGFFNATAWLRWI